MIETVWQDIRYAYRTFRRAPLFALTVVGTIAVGLGLNTAVFTVFNGYVLKPFEVRDPYSLYEVHWITRAGVAPRFTWAEYEALRGDRSVFTEVFAEHHAIITRVDGHTTYVRLVSGNYFRAIGIDAALGRTIQADDAAAPGGAAVAVLSHAFWLRQFGGDPSIVGRTIRVQGYPCEIVGVARQGFDGLDLAPPTDVWLPITIARAVQDDRDLFGPDQPRRVNIVGRLQPGITTEAASAALLLTMQNLTRGLPTDDQARSVGLTSRATSVPLSPMTMFALSPVLVAFAMVLLIACANVANMMLARAVARQRELGIRLTLGAGRSRLVAQLLTESVLLALPAAALGFVISRAAIDIGVRLMFATLPAEFSEYIRVAPLPPDVRVLAFMVVAAVATSVLFGLAPALQATRSSVVQMARGDFGADFGASRLRTVLVVGQITAAAALLITAAVLVRSTQRVAAIEPGLRTRDIVTFDVRDRDRDRIVQSLAAHPLVVGVTASSPIPLDAMAPGVGVATAERPDLIRLQYRFVSASFFEVFGLGLVAGRTFTAEEAGASAPVAVLSETAVARLWPDRDAIGRTVRLVGDPRKSPTDRIARFQTVRVVGVARDNAADVGNDGPRTAAIMLPMPLNTPGSGLVVRVAGEAEAARRSLDTALAIVAPGGVTEIHKLQEFVAGRLYPYRVAYWISAAVGVLALLLTLSGVYGVLSYVVAQRTKELSIRMALGADVRTVVWFVVRHSAGLAAIGLPTGTVVALAAARAFASRVPMVDVFDAAAFIAGVVAVLVACLVAALVPAIRASRLDPMTMLRAD